MMVAATTKVFRVLLPNGREEGDPSQGKGGVPSVDVNNTRLTATEVGDAGWIKVGPRHRQQNRSTYHVNKASNASTIHSQGRAEKSIQCSSNANK